MTPLARRNTSTAPSRWRRRAGPVALALPEDMLFALTDTPDLPPMRPTRAAAMAQDMAAVAELLAKAERPLLLLGGSMWTEAGHRAVTAFAKAHDLPVTVGFRRQGLFPHDHPNFAGSLGFGGIPEPNGSAQNADLIIALGSRLNDPTTTKHRIIPPHGTAKLVHIHPGDGDFLMNGQELASAVHYGLNPVSIIIDNGKFGTIRGNQEARHPGRISGTTLTNPDFAALAISHGALGERVTTTPDVAPALDRALTAGRAAVIHVLVGPDSLGPDHQLGVAP